MVSSTERVLGVLLVACFASIIVSVSHDWYTGSGWSGSILELALAALLLVPLVHRLRGRAHQVRPVPKPGPRVSGRQQP